MARNAKLEVLPLPQWPSEDRRLWEAACIPGDCLRSGGRISEWRAITHRSALKCYSHYLHFLKSRDLLDPHGRPSDRIAEGCLRPFVAALRGRLAPQSVGHILDTISMVVGAIEPNSDRTVIKRAAVWMKRHAVPRMIKRGRIVSPVALFEAGLKHIELAKLEARAADKAVLYRDGLAVALMALLPLRIKTFTHLRLEKNFHSVGGSIRLVIQGREMKTGKGLDVLFPTDLRWQFAEYLLRHHPILCSSATESPFLWLNQKGERLSENHMRLQFYRVTEMHMGVKISPHLFRDAAATYISEMMPEQARIAAAVLQHTCFETTEKHYIEGCQISSHQKYHAAILNLLGEVNGLV